MKPTYEPTHAEDDQLWLGWKWFEYHSKQRIESFKFFMTIFGAVVAVGVTLLRPPTTFVSLVLSLFGALACIVFWQLDVRSRQLIEIGEAIISARWEGLGFPEALNPVKAATAHHQAGIRFKNAFLLAFVCALAGAIILFGVSVYGVHYPKSITSVGSH